MAALPTTHTLRTAGERRFDPEKCRQRRLRAARLDVEAAPFRFLAEDEAMERLFGSETLRVRSSGSIPATVDAALVRINALLPSGADALGPDDVYVHVVEAANGRFIPDRYMFLHGTTLKNIAKDADEGRSLMNSHRTGGFCSDAELPFGKTFAGRYETGDDGIERTLAAAYMLRGLKPNGESGPTTDDLDRMIRGGVISDVSVGLWPGAMGCERCDVCGKELMGWDEDDETGPTCPHVPGTDYRMTSAEVSSQKRRGVPTGYASYSLHEYRMGEVSPVFDGAVPGAGFKKALSLARGAGLDEPALALCRTHYSFSRAFTVAPHEQPAVVAEPDNDLDTGEARVALSFEEQLTEARVALRGCIDRTSRLQRLSHGRWTDLTDLRNELDTLLAEREPDTVRLRRLRLQNLAMRVRDLPAPA